MSESSSSQYPVSGPELPEGFDTLSPDWAAVEALKEEIVQILVQRGIDPSSVLFAGYDPSRPKNTEQEFLINEGTYGFFFGDIHSLRSPRATDDEETAEERWVANPLRYATAPGTVLGVYDATRLMPYFDPEQTDREFGTYVAVGDSGDIESARLLEIQLQQSSVTS